MPSTSRPQSTLLDLISGHTNIHTLTVLATKSTRQDTRNAAAARLAELEGGCFGCEREDCVDCWSMDQTFDSMPEGL